MKYAKIENNAIKQIQPNNQDGFVEVADGVVCGMIKDGDNFVNPEILQTSEDIKIVRDQIRENGFDFNGFKIKADKETQNDLVSIVVSFNSGLMPDDTVIPWKVDDGSYMEIDGKTEVLLLSARMTQFVQLAFSVEAAINYELGSDNSINIVARFNELMGQ